MRRFLIASPPSMADNCHKVLSGESIGASAACAVKCDPVTSSPYKWLVNNYSESQLFAGGGMKVYLLIEIDNGTAGATHQVR